MNRWIKAVFLTFMLLVYAALAATAQTMTREAPADVRAGRLVITQSPEARLDGKPDRLSPGARIRDTQNMLVLPGSLTGREVPVLYRREPMGMLHELWLLTEAEYTRLGGHSGTGDPQAVREFQNLLALIFGQRTTSGRR